MKSNRVYRFAFSLALLCAPCAKAQFGSGIVFDPTQSAHAISQIRQAAQEFQKEEQIYTTALQTRDQIISTYNLAFQMARMPQNLAARYKASFSQWTNLSAPDTYGGTSAWIQALDIGGQTQASTAYKNAVVQLQAYPTSRYSALDPGSQRTIENQYATSELSQGTTVSTLSTLGAIRSKSESFATQLANLEADSFATTSDQQTEMAVLGKINTATLLQIHSQQDTNQLLAASVQQQLVAQKQQIDAQNRTINNAIYFEQNFATAMQKINGGVSDAMHSISLSPTGH